MDLGVISAKNYFRLFLIDVDTFLHESLLSEKKDKLTANIFHLSDKIEEFVEYFNSYLPKPELVFPKTLFTKVTNAFFLKIENSIQELLSFIVDLDKVFNPVNSDKGILHSRSVADLFSVLDSISNFVLKIKYIDPSNSILFCDILNKVVEVKKEKRINYFLIYYFFFYFFL
jgi:hypothetical protein